MKEARWKRFASYSAALGALMRPNLWDDRFCFRIVSRDWRAAGGPRLTLGEGSYFDLIDQSGPLTRELSATAHRSADPLPAWRRLPLRARYKSEPLSLGRRVVLASVGTLTIRRTADGQGEFYVLRRIKGRTATSDDTHNVLPGGMLQPASISPLSRRSDLSVWRNIMREFNEEMLGAPEAVGQGGAEVDYTRRPYSDFEQALTAGTLRVWTFGMGLEALILTPVLLTIAVFEADVFDVLFADLVLEGPEGIVITKMPLRDAEVGDLLKLPNVAPPLAALLHLALRHRDLLLSAPVRTT
ncbi:XRE family transcriptional regulator [Streptomyces sp. SID3343]|uniref:XRE family transcriptional regulator n=1 Tax=Streptomyces sp. SID3343 TaxID=2690260 RepID=UPI0013711A0F|nr:XRE family transcriptional regulator [Streptomyces sp. SID3343]MYW06421.1 XRE family transcriptional regulator [Streptomyces sp. SID3343]